MNNKRYYDRFTIGLTVFFKVSISIFILGVLSKYILFQADLLIEKPKELNNLKTIIKLIASTLFGGLIIYSLICFYQFMIKANRVLLFSNATSRLWEHISTDYLIIGACLIGLGVMDTDFLSSNLVFGLISSIAYSSIKIFKDGANLKQENDLTI